MKKICLLFFALLLVCNVPVTGTGKQSNRNIILDVDTSGDDLMAILYMLLQPDVDIRAITIVKGVSDVERGTEIVLRLLALTGHADIPVAMGADVPLRRPC